MSRLLSSVALGILVVLSLSFVSAETLVNKTVVNGVVYDANFTKVVKDAQVTITCNGASPSAELTDSSGSYAIIFPDFEACGPGSLLSGEARLGDQVATQPSFKIMCGNTTLCSGVSCNGNSNCTDSSMVVLLNFGLGAKVQPPVVVVGGGGGGGGGGFISPKVNVSNSTNLVAVADTTNTNVTQASSDAKTETPRFLSRITGAVIGVFGNAGTGIIVVVLILLAGSFIGLRVRKARSGKDAVSKEE